MAATQPGAGVNTELELNQTVSTPTKIGVKLGAALQQNAKDMEMSL
uniref:Uncharacterized protein n=1 Tax=Oryza sativa subsp. japonica TaxID=39947 RepID=Q108W2_ORYSJ|nr:hypothetical protein LOC_Os10g42234 [Oryza sativa Japonica Group]